MNIILQILILSFLLFTPIRIYIEELREADKTPEILAKEAAKNKYFLLLSKEIRQKFGFEIENDWWPDLKPEIYYVTFRTIYPHEVPCLEEARKVMVETISFILSYLNDNPEIRPFLAKYPLTSENMFLHINFLKNHEREDGWCATTLVRGLINYTYLYDQIDIPPETFEEAKAKVEAERKK